MGLLPVPILCYHRIVGGPLPRYPDSLNVHELEFAEQLQLLQASGYESVDFDFLAGVGNDAGGMTGKPIIITFDDGYRDNVVRALPAMEEAGFHGVIFPIAAKITGEDNSEETPGHEKATVLELRRLIDAGWEIGSHGYFHRNLVHLDDDALAHETARSKVVLEELLNLQIRTFSYPFSSHNRQVREATARAGYRFGCGVRRGALFTGGDPMSLRRIPVFGGAGAARYRRSLAISGRMYALAQAAAASSLRPFLKR